MIPEKVLSFVYGSVESDWHQHSTGKGWVYKTAHVNESVYLHSTSIVYGNARVSGDALVSGNALVYGNAQVYGNARVSGNAQVSGNALVYGDAQVYGNARVYGDALVYGNAQVSGDAQVYGDALVCGDAQVSGNAWETPVPYIQGSRHALTLCSLTQIAIGCHVHDISDWLKRYRAIGRAEKYTKEQIEEYGRHLRYLAYIAKRLTPKKPRKRTVQK